MAEHITVIHIVVVHEQFAAIGGIVEIVCEIAHHAVEVVALVNDMPGKGFLVLPLAAVAVLEVVEALATPLHESVHGLLVVDFRQPDIFGDFIPCFLPHAAFAVPLTGEFLVVLEHQLWVVFVGVASLAEVDEVLVAVEGGEVNPQAGEVAAVVFGVCSAVERRIFVAVVGLVLGDGLAQRFGRVVEFFEAVDDFLTESWR